MKVPAKQFSKQSACRKRWLITKEDREEFESIKLEKVKRRYEKVRTALIGK